MLKNLWFFAICLSLNLAAMDDEDFDESDFFPSISEDENNQICEEPVEEEQQETEKNVTGKKGLSSSAIEISNGRFYRDNDEPLTPINPDLMAECKGSLIRYMRATKSHSNPR